MKKSSIYIIFVLIVVAAIVAGLAVRYVPSVVPYWQCSEVYKRYSKVEGVRASYIKDYRINDTLTLGVTLLEATDSAGWEYLLQKFNASQDEKNTADTSINTNKVWVRLASKGHPEEIIGSSSLGNSSNSEEQIYEMVVTDYDLLNICIVHTSSIEDLSALIDYCYNNPTHETNHFNKR